MRSEIALEILLHRCEHRLSESQLLERQDIQAGDSGLRLDLGVRGVWQPQAEALFDFKVIDTDARSYSSRSPESVLESGAQDKQTFTSKQWKIVEVLLHPL